MTGEIHCERCGLRAAAEVATIEFCIDCGLFVCRRRCWRTASNLCQACSGGAGSLPHGRGSSVLTARRADRRLREAGVEAITIAALGKSRAVDASAEIPCLTIKAAAAERAGTRALRRMRGKGSGRVRPLADRIGRNAAVVRAQIERAAAARDDRGESLPIADVVSRKLTEPPVSPTSESRNGTPTSPPPWQRRHTVWVLGTGTLIILAVAVSASAWLGQQRTADNQVGEGVLGAVASLTPQDVTYSPPAVLSQEVNAVPPAVDPAASPSTLGFDFNSVRMGDGIGQHWRSPPDDAAGVTVAAYPTAVNRSARVRVGRDGVAESCLSIDPPLADVHLFSLELTLDAEVPALAVIHLRDAVGDPVVTLELDESGAVFSANGREALAKGGGLEPGRWYGLELVNENVGVWRLFSLDDPSDARLDMRVDWPSTTPVGEICLRAQGRPDAAVNYDNLSITNE